MEDREGPLRWLQELLATPSSGRAPPVQLLPTLSSGWERLWCRAEPFCDGGSRTSWEKCWLSWSVNATNSGSPVPGHKAHPLPVFSSLGTATHIHM